MKYICEPFAIISELAGGVTRDHPVLVSLARKRPEGHLTRFWAAPGKRFVTLFVACPQIQNQTLSTSASP